MSDTKTYPKTQSFSTNVHYALSVYPRKTGPDIPVSSETFIDLTSHKTGSKLPNYRELIARGLDATTNFNAVRKDNIKCSAGSFQQYWGSDNYNYKYSNGNGMFCDIARLSPAVTSASQDNSLNHAKQIAVSKANNILSPLKGGVVLGELAETVRLIKNPLRAVRGLINSYIDVLKKVPRRANSLHKKHLVEDTWLETQFGILPLVGDIHDGVKALREMQYTRPNNIERLRVRTSDGGSTFVSTTDVYGVSSFNTQVRTICKEQTQLSIGIKVVTDLANQRDWGEVSGLTFAQFLPTAWELLPWSFLIDYFTNIGSIINASSAVNSSIAYCSYTRRKVEHVSISDQNRILGGSSYVTVDEFVRAYAERKIITTTRTSISNLTPDFRFTLPDVFSVKSLNIGALFSKGSIRVPFF